MKEDIQSVQVSKANGTFEIVERDIPEPGAKVRIKVEAEVILFYTLF